MSVSTSPPGGGGASGTPELLQPRGSRSVPHFTGLRSISALMLREMSTRYGRTPGGYVWALVEPLGMILIMAYVWSLLAKSPSLGTSFILFKATGYMVLQMFTTLGGQVGKALGFSRPLLQYPRVSWIDAVFARFTLNALVVAVVTVIILSGVMIYEQIRTVLAWGPILMAMGLAAALGLGVGCLNCYLFRRFPVWNQIWAILTRPLFLISGVIVTYEAMPQQAQAVLWYNPILHLTGMMRDGFYPIYRPEYISVTYVAVWILVPMVAGLLLLRRHSLDLLYR